MNEKIKEYGYLQFPLCLLKETYSNIKSGLDLIIDFGIMNYALKMDYKLYDVAKQTAYYFYRKQDVLQPSIIQKFNNAVDNNTFTPDEDYNGFSDKVFQPDDNISEILKLFESDPKLKEDCTFNYLLHLATSGDHLNIKINSNKAVIKHYNEALKIKQEFEARFGTDAMPCCKQGMLFDFRDKHQKDIDTFRAYIGILSLIGQRNFISTTKPVVLSRMTGAKSKDAYSSFCEDPIIKITVKKYSNRYWMDKLLFTLAQRKFIMYLTEKHKRLIYVSKYMEPKELANRIKERRDMRDLKQLQKEALQHLYNTT